MVSFNNSIMIRNHAGDPVKSTARLIETLKKVGIIKTKKRRAKRSLATSDEVRQDSDMGPGYAMPTPQMPPQFGGSPQQQDFNAQRIEDVQRQAGNQIALLRGRIQQLESGPTRFQPQQRIEGPRVEQMPSAERPVLLPESEEFQGERSGPQPDQGSARMGIDYDTTSTAIFAGEEPPSPSYPPPEISAQSDDSKIQYIAGEYGFEIPSDTMSVSQLREIIQSMNLAFERKIAVSGNKQQLITRIRNEAIKQFNKEVSY